PLMGTRSVATLIASVILGMVMNWARGEAFIVMTWGWDGLAMGLTIVGPSVSERAAFHIPTSQYRGLNQVYEGTTISPLSSLSRNHRPNMMSGRTIASTAAISGPMATRVTSLRLRPASPSTTARPIIGMAQRMDRFR